MATIVSVMAGLMSLPAGAADGARYVSEVFDDVTVTEEIQFGAASLSNYHSSPDDPTGIDENGRQRLYLDLYEPVGDESTQRPVFVWAHGGGGTGGSRAGGRDVEFSTAFAKRGWVVASIDYRLMAPFEPAQALGDLGLPLPSFVSSLSPFNLPYLKDIQHDMQAAVRWLRANAAALKIDANKIMTGGHSAGTAPALLTNFADPNDVGDSGNPGFPSHVSAAMASSGGMLIPDGITPGDPPIVTFNALDDSYYSIVLTMGNACLPTMAMGNTCDFTIFSQGGHGLAGHTLGIQQHTAQFFCSHVLGDCG
ncbi:MAG: hypothetical protein WD646_05710 [Actinomycetota bacterium]